MTYGVPVVPASEVGIPISPEKETDRPGYEYDPYGHKDAAGYDQYTDIHPNWIPFHNYRQIHIAQKAFYEGYRAVKPLPECPPLWGDMGHYWNSTCLFGYICYEIPRVGGGVILAIVAGWAKTKGWI